MGVGFCLINKTKKEKITEKLKGSLQTVPLISLRMKNRCLIYLLLLILILSVSVGCNYRIKDPNTVPTDSPSTRKKSTTIAKVSKTNWYKNFISEDKQESLKESGIDIVSIVEKYVDDVSDITFMHYDIVNCNISKQDVNYNDDVLIKIEVNRNWWKNDCMIICAFKYVDDLKYKNIFTEQYNYVDYRIMDLTGDNMDEIILVPDYTQSTGGPEIPISILSYDLHTKKMVSIFNEMLDGGVAPFKKVKNTDCWTMEYTNDYKFTPSKNRGYDIIMNCIIFEKPNPSKDEFAPYTQGSMKFKYNGEKYVVEGRYYDYKAIAQKIYNERQ